MQPEVMGLSATATFGVHEGAAVAAAAAAAAAAVLPCPAACSGRGQCDAATGLCACDEASAGGDCSAPRAALALSISSATVHLSASMPTVSLSPTLVTSAATATAAAVPLAHVCVLAPTPTRAQLGQARPSLADECAPTVSVAEGGSGEVVLEFSRPVDGCTCSAAAEEGGTAAEGGVAGEAVEPLMYIVSGSADGILFDSERVAVSVGCRRGVRPPPPTVDACASAFCTMDICPDGMGRRPVGDECCSCLAASQSLVVLTMTAGGSVDDYADTSSLRGAIAAIADVDASAVTVAVTAASVLITVTITVPAAATPAAVQALLTSSLGTADAASAALGITVLSVPTVVVAVPPSPLASPASPPPLSKDGAPAAAASDVSAVVLATAVPGTIAGMLCLVALGVLVLRCRMRSRLRLNSEQLGEHEGGQVVLPAKP